MDAETAQREDSREKTEESPTPVDSDMREYIGREARHAPKSVLVDTTFAHMEADIVAKLHASKEDEPQARKIAEYIAAEIRPMVKDLHPLTNLRVLLNIGQKPEFKAPFPDAPYFSELVDSKEGAPQSHLSAPNETPPDLKSENVAYGLSFMVQPVERHTNERMWGWGIGDSPTRKTAKTENREYEEYAALHARAAEREIQHAGHRPHLGGEVGLGAAALTTAAGLGLAGEEFYKAKEEDRKKDFEASDRSREGFFKQKEGDEKNRRVTETQKREREDRERDDEKTRLTAEDDKRRAANAIADQAAKVESLLAQIRENQDTIRRNPRNSPLLAALAAAMGGLRIVVGGGQTDEGALLSTGLEEVSAAVQPWAAAEADKKKQDEDSGMDRKAENEKVEDRASEGRKAQDEEAENIEDDETARVESLLAAIEAHQQAIRDNPAESPELNALSQAEIQLGISAGVNSNGPDEDRAGIDIDTGREDLSKDEDEKLTGTPEPLGAAAEEIRARETSAEPVAGAPETPFGAVVPEYARHELPASQEAAAELATEAAAEITGEANAVGQPRAAQNLAEGVVEGVGPETQQTVAGEPSRAAARMGENADVAAVSTGAATPEPEEPEQPTELNAQAPSVIGEHLAEEVSRQAAEPIRAQPEAKIVPTETAQPERPGEPAAEADIPAGEAVGLAELRPQEPVQPTQLQAEAPSVIGEHLADEVREQAMEPIAARPETGFTASETVEPERRGEPNAEAGTSTGESAAGLAELRPQEPVQPTQLQAEAPSVIGEHVEEQFKGVVRDEIAQPEAMGSAPVRPEEATGREGDEEEKEDIRRATDLQAEAVSKLRGSTSRPMADHIEDRIRDNVIQDVASPLRGQTGGAVAPSRAAAGEGERNTAAAAQVAGGTPVQPQSIRGDAAVNQRRTTVTNEGEAAVSRAESGRRGVERTTTATPERQTGGNEREGGEEESAKQASTGYGALHRAHEAETLEQLATVRMSSQAGQQQAGAVAGTQGGDAQPRTGGEVEAEGEENVAEQAPAGRGALHRAHKAETIEQLATVKIPSQGGQSQAGASPTETQAQAATVARPAQGQDDGPAAENAEGQIGPTVREEIARSVTQAGASAATVSTHSNAASAAKPTDVTSNKQATPAVGIAAEQKKPRIRDAAQNPKAPAQAATAQSGKPANDRGARASRNVAERTARKVASSRPIRRIAEAAHATRQPVADKRAATARQRVQTASPPQNIAAAARVKRVVKAKPEVAQTHPFAAMRRAGKASAPTRTPQTVARAPRAVAPNPREKPRSKRFMAPAARTRPPNREPVLRPAPTGVKPIATATARRLPSQKVESVAAAGQRKRAPPVKPAIIRKAQPLRAPRSEIRRVVKKTMSARAQRSLPEPEPE